MIIVYEGVCSDYYACIFIADTGIVAGEGIGANFKVDTAIGIYAAVQLSEIIFKDAHRTASISIGMCCEEYAALRTRSRDDVVVNGNIMNFACKVDGCRVITCRIDIFKVEALQRY